MRTFVVVAILVVDVIAGRSVAEIAAAVILIVVLVAAAPSRPPVEWEDA